MNSPLREIRRMRHEIKQRALRARDGDPLMVRGAVSYVIFLSNFFEPG